jgi:hypothetical protein
MFRLASSQIAGTPLEVIQRVEEEAEMLLLNFESCDKTLFSIRPAG